MLSSRSEKGMGLVKRAEPKSIWAKEGRGDGGGGGGAGADTLAPAPAAAGPETGSPLCESQRKMEGMGDLGRGRGRRWRRPASGRCRRRRRCPRRHSDCLRRPGSSRARCSDRSLRLEQAGLEVGTPWGRGGGVEPWWGGKREERMAGPRAEEDSTCPSAECVP